MPCLQFFGRRKLALVFRKSPSSLKEFIGYVELTDFREIWPELTLMTKEQKYVSEFIYFKYFSRGGLWRLRFWELFDAGTWQFHKKITNENTGKCWHTYFVINTAQSFCINNRISYPINSTEGKSVILAFTGFCRLMKGVAKENIIFLEFYIS